mmetsp:Transcript_6076/g.7662  ORF Transcript_6076/g.7662 Transcript_6076/m.7662 type:complete len:100 (-) Transcript_6076:27-326(-)
MKSYRAYAEPFIFRLRKRYAISPDVKQTIEKTKQNKNSKNFVDMERVVLCDQMRHFPLEFSLKLLPSTFKGYKANRCSQYCINVYRDDCVTKYLNYITS